MKTGIVFGTLLVLAAAVTPAIAAAQPVEVFACEPEWGALATELGGEHVSVFTATTAFQDPHHIEARPSLIARARRAQLLVCTGAELEIGWLPVLQRRSGNPAIQDGSPGVFFAADAVERIEIPDTVDRSQGDVHASGNPHVHLDPHRLLGVASALTERLVALDPGNVAYYHHRAERFAQRWRAAIDHWEQRAGILKGVTVVVHHRSFSYLFDWLEMKTVGDLEPKPGLPPTSRHLAQLLSQSRERPPAMIVQASFQNPDGANWLGERLGVPVVALPLTVGGSESANDLFSLFDTIIDQLVLFQHDMDGFSWCVSVQGKAALAANGCSLRKRANAAMGAYTPTLRGGPVVARSRVAALDKGTTIACALRLAANHHRVAESIHIMLKEY